MRNPKFYKWLAVFLLFLGILIQSQPILQFRITKNLTGEEIRNIRTSAPEYPGMTAIEWDLLECPGDDRHIIMYIPDTYDPNVSSAVIWSLHGMWQGIDTAEYYGFYAPHIQGIECYQVAPYGNAIVIVPQGYNAPFVMPWIGNEYGWDSNNTDPDNEDVEFYRWFIEDYLVNNEVGNFGILNINRRRIYIGGYSMGGMINICAGKIRDGQDFAAMYHIAGGKFFDELVNVSRKYPAYVVIGSDDTTNGEYTQALLNTYIAGNHPYYYQEYPDVDHTEAMLAENIDPFHSPKTFFEDCWDWLVQWALNDKAILLSGTSEEFGDYYKFSVIWKDADNDDPTHKMVVNVDGIEYSMEKGDPTDLDNTDGCLYTCMVSSSVLGEGMHYYYFEGIEGDHYGPYNIIEAGQGPYDVSTAKTNIANFSISEIIDKFPTADFLIDKMTVSVGEQIHFTFTGSEGNPPHEFIWDFGDGYNSSERNPTHIYNVAGNFSVSLTIIDYDGDSDYIIKTEVISVEEAPEPEPEIPEQPVIPGFPLVPLGISSLLCYFGLLLNKRKRKIQY